MAKRANRDLERHYTRSQFVAKLRRLADALEAKKPFVIQVASERLHIPAQVTFNVEHERTSALDELEFQLRWSHAGAKTTVAKKRPSGKRKPVARSAR